MRMSALLGQWELRHVIPVWSTEQQFGLGSPMLALYHKTHMYLSTALLILTGSVKAAMVLSLFLLMVAGFGGMCFCMRHALGGRHPWLWMVTGAVLLASNYATTDWAVRGAFAEFAALMLLPWIFAWCLILLGQGRWRWWIGPAVALLALSHSSLGLFSVVPLAIALAVACWRWRGHARSWLAPACRSAGLALLLLLPFALPMAVVSRFNQIDRLVLGPYFTAWTNTIPVDRYVWDPYWTWGATWRNFTVQLDSGLLVLFVLYLAFLVPARRMPFASGETARDDRWNAIFLVSSLAVMAWLQLPQAAWVYLRVPGASYLQFPWRLLAYMTVILVICAGVSLSRLASVGPARRGWGVIAASTAAVALVIATAYPKMWWRWNELDWLGSEVLEEDFKSRDYVAFGEFLPLVDWPPVPGLVEAAPQMQAWLARPVAQACTVVAIERDVRRVERRSGYWDVTCPMASAVTIPVFWAPGMAVLAQSQGADDWRELVPQRGCSDPRLQVHLLAGVNRVQVKFPTWGRTVAAGWSRQAFDFRRDCQSRGP